MANGDYYGNVSGSGSSPANDPGSIDYFPLDKGLLYGQMPSSPQSGPDQHALRTVTPQELADLRLQLILAASGLAKDSPAYTGLRSFQSTALNFAFRFIQDGPVRSDYIKQIAQMSQTILLNVKSGRITAADGATIANGLRNDILDASRVKSTDIGRAFAEALKKEGKTLPQLLETYAGRRFNSPFANLTSAQKEKVYLDVIKAAGRDSKFATRCAKIAGPAGRYIALLSFASAVYSVATAEDKLKESGKQILTMSASFLASVGAGAGLAALGAPPLAIGAGVLFAGAGVAYGIELTYDWYYGLWSPKPQ
jgi:hypothetical protein